MATPTTSTTPISPARSQDSLPTQDTHLQELAKKVEELSQEITKLWEALARKGFQIQELERQMKNERSMRLTYDRSSP